MKKIKLLFLIVFISAICFSQTGKIYKGVGDADTGRAVINLITGGSLSKVLDSINPLFKPDSPDRANGTATSSIISTLGTNSWEIDGTTAEIFITLDDGTNTGIFHVAPIAGNVRIGWGDNAETKGVTLIFNDNDATFLTTGTSTVNYGSDPTANLSSNSMAPARFVFLPSTGTGTAVGDITGDLNAFNLTITNTAGAGLNLQNTYSNLLFSGIGQFSVGSSGIFVEDDRATPRGLQYDNDYSATLNSLSLTPKVYVDKVVSLPVYHYLAVTANHTVDENDFFIDCTSNSFTVTLPTAVGIDGKAYIIKNSGTATIITMATTSSETIDGSAPSTITTKTPLRVISDGSNWVIY